MISCYKYGTFTRIEEVMTLRSKLENSVQYVSTSLDRMILDLIQGAKSVESVIELVRSFEMNPLKDRTDWDILCDNRDFKSFGVNSLQTEKGLEGKKSWTFECEKRWLQIRSLIIRSIAASFYSLEAKIMKIDPFITNGCPGPVSPLSFLIDHLKQHQSELTSSFPPSNVVWGPATPRLTGYMKQPYLDIVINTLQLVYCIETDSKEFDTKLVIFDPIVDDVIHKGREVKLLRDNMVLLDTISHVVDCFGFVCVILALTTNYFKVTNQSKKNRKKMKDLSLSANLLDVIESVNEDLETNIIRLNSFISNDLKLVNKMNDSLLDKIDPVWDRKVFTQKSSVI